MFALPLIDATKARGFAVKTAIMDKGYDNEPIHRGCVDRGSFRSRHFARLPLSFVATASRFRARTGSGPSRAPASSAGLRSGDALRASASVRPCGSRPTVCTPDPAYNGAESKLCCSRGAVEREFGRLEREWAMLPLRVRGLDRVRLRADLTILAKLTIALGRARACQLPHSSTLANPWQCYGVRSGGG
jgi:Transposase DDE domain